jgi:hypothetical protein
MRPSTAPTNPLDAGLVEHVDKVGWEGRARYAPILPSFTIFEDDAMFITFI